MTDAITREEKLMEAMANGSVSNIKPITREEMFLAKAGGQDVQTPEPITRREKLLQSIIDNGGGGGSTGGGGDENFVGVKLSNFAEDGYKLPRVADARSLQKIIDSIPEDSLKETAKSFIASRLFENANSTPNGGGIWPT